MKLAKITIGMSVVVNNLPDATIYQVGAIRGFLLDLTYKLGNGNSISGGTVDYTFVQLPTKTQIANFEKDLLPT